MLHLQANLPVPMAKPTSLCVLSAKKRIQKTQLLKEVVTQELLACKQALHMGYLLSNSQGAGERERRACNGPCTI